MNSKLLIVGAMPGFMLLAACVNEPIAQRDPALGEAVKFNAAVQTINPDPVYAADGAMPGDNGEHAAKAVGRYRKGQVTPVQTMQTTTGTTTGGGTK